MSTTDPTQPSTRPWPLATASYRSFQTSMGVPIRTSIGTPDDYAHAPDARSLAPWGIFRRLDDLPAEDQAAAYRTSLDQRTQRIETELDLLTRLYRGHRLVLLCFCYVPPGDDLACHRRWAARWLLDRHDLDVPEITPLGEWTTAPEPPTRTNQNGTWSAPEPRSRTTGNRQDPGPARAPSTPSTPDQRSRPSQPRLRRSQQAPRRDHPGTDR